MLHIFLFVIWLVHIRCGPLPLNTTPRPAIATSRLAKALCDIIFEFCLYDNTTYLQEKADAINALTDIDMTVNDNDMSVYILGGLEADFQLPDFHFFLATPEYSDYHCLVADIQAYINSPSFKMKYEKRNK